VIEGSDSFAVDAPTIGTPRQLEVLTSLDQPLHPGDWIELTSGVGTDQLGGSFTIAIGSQTCTQNVAVREDSGSIGL